MGKLIGSVDEIISSEVTFTEKEKKISKAFDKQERSMAGNTISDFSFGQPGRGQAEIDIQGRESVLSEFIDASKDLADGGSITETAGDIFNTLMSGSELVIERTVGTASAAALELADPFRKESLKDAGIAVLDQLTGKRIVKPQDVLTARLPEMELGGVDIRKPIAIIGGLGAEIGMPLKVLSGIKQASKGSKGTLDIVQGVRKTAGEMKSFLGKKIGKLFSSGVGSKSVNQRELTNALNKLPDDVMKTILDNPKVFGVVEDVLIKTGERIIGFSGARKFTKKIKTGLPKNNAENIWKLRMALDDMLSSKDYVGKITSKAKGVIKSVADDLRGSLGRVDEQIGPLMDDFSDFSKKLGAWDDVGMTAKGRLKVNALANALKRKADPATREAVLGITTIMPKAAKMVQALHKLNKRRAVVDAGILFGKAAVGSALLSKFMKSSREVFVEPSTSGGGGPK